MAQEKVFVLGGTGSVGTYAVNHLLSKNIPVTLYSRDAQKAKSKFNTSNASLLNIIEGDYKDLNAFKKDIQGHSRLIMILAFDKQTNGLQPILAKHAYEAGVKQIVYISSNNVEYGFRSEYIANVHYEAEESIRAIPNRGYFVALRPGYFMSNVMTYTRPDPNGVLSLVYDGDETRGFISPRDIGEMAATVASEDPDKHEDSSYSLLGEVSTFNKLVQTLTEVTGKQFTYKQITPIEMYNQFIRFVPHTLALTFAEGFRLSGNPTVSIVIEILLGRKPQTLKEYFLENKEALAQIRQ
ncbi:hypothetical protein BD560DRAFT_348688 [Blakeslea trispora]|nr:hypothetical protein BD560DRAFT_348688 [Blakeslea trispora]